MQISGFINKYYTGDFIDEIHPYVTSFWRLSTFAVKIFKDLLS